MWESGLLFNNITPLGQEINILGLAPGRFCRVNDLHAGFVLGFR
jgi:hypothetical protein